ncbi:MAG: hypothetical protein US50_C0052G0015 [Candidatus Nomurabacteria bacterium GW2011_GWB1_37_5]|uniref:Uncharacterized protein n=1 Tax=Candidatus Nomurabacteria bacterium GW2011_GWB1_37_5 TaxID=1618742 RepID=A0A0G0JC35_9BACT|nr:MAG: hypothetical protein US50_C0052G0015 [Candidatus Nomurabacteria bacterium GW2011_GWB1_37_5]
MKIIARNIVLFDKNSRIGREANSFLDQYSLEQNLRKSGFKSVKRIQDEKKSILSVIVPDLSMKTYECEIPREIIQMENYLHFDFRIMFSERLYCEYKRKQICNNYNGKIIVPYMMKNGVSFYIITQGYTLIAFNKHEEASEITKFHLKRNYNKVILYADEPTQYRKGKELSNELKKFREAIDFVNA